MNEFNPGDGWREVPPGPSRERRLALLTDGVIEAMWVREDPLPTKPYTVIRTGPMRWMKCGLYVHPDGSEGNPDAWILLPYDSQAERRAIQAARLSVSCTYDVESVREQVAEFGFEVLAEPSSGWSRDAQG